MLAGGPKVFDLANDLETSADGALVVDEGLEVVYANRSARRILGDRLADSTLQYCYQIVQGRDDRNRPICHEFCLVAKRVSSGKPVPSFDLRVPIRAKGERWMNVSVFRHSAEKTGRSHIVHFFRDVTERKKDAEFADRLIEAARQRYNIEVGSVTVVGPSRQQEGLTLREREVLELLVDGRGTREIAQQLSISVNTTRNHIQRILRKLDVHTRVEAVVYAINNDLGN